METAQIVKDLTSREVDGVRRSGWYVISHSQKEEVIQPLVPYLSEIFSKTRGLSLGGGFAPNNRFAEYSVKIIAHYSKDESCSCTLFPEIGLDLNPEADFNNVEIIETVKIENQWVDFHHVRCRKCGQTYQVFERDGHWLFYEWKKFVKFQA
jgi:hypothetical protein